MKLTQKQRLVLIKSMRKSGATYDVIGKKFKVTSERIRQLLHPQEELYCKTHKRGYETRCEICYVVTVYPRVVNSFLAEGGIDALKAEFDRLSRLDRSKPVVFQRAILIKALRNREKFSFAKVAKLLNRDYGSIRALYDKKLK